MADRARAAGAFALIPKGGKPRRICDAVLAAAEHTLPVPGIEELEAGIVPEPPPHPR